MGETVSQKLTNLLGICQKLIASKANDHHAFFILNSLIVALEPSALENYIPQMMKLVFQRILKKKTNKIVRGLLLLLSTLILHYGPNTAIGLINKVQNNMFVMVLEKLVLPDLVTSASAGSPRDKRAITYAIAYLITEESTFTAQENHHSLGQNLTGTLGTLQIPFATR